MAAAALLLVSVLAGTLARAASCEDVQRAVREAPAAYTVTAQIWLDGRETYYARIRVLDGRAKILEKREDPGTRFQLDASRPLAVPSCSSLVRLRPGVWQARERVREISGERILVYYFSGNRLSRIETRETGTVGALFFKKALRTKIVYTMEAR